MTVVESQSPSFSFTKRSACYVYLCIPRKITMVTPHRRVRGPLGPAESCSYIDTCCTPLAPLLDTRHVRLYMTTIRPKNPAGLFFTIRLIRYPAG